MAPLRIHAVIVPAEEQDLVIWLSLKTSLERWSATESGTLYWMRRLVTLTSALVTHDIMMTMQETLCKVIVFTLSLNSLEELEDRKDSIAFSWSPLAFFWCWLLSELQVTSDSPWCPWDTVFEQSIQWNGCSFPFTGIIMAVSLSTSPEIWFVAGWSTEPFCLTGHHSQILKPNYKQLLTFFSYCWLN